MRPSFAVSNGETTQDLGQQATGLANPCGSVSRAPLWAFWGGPRVGGVWVVALGSGPAVRRALFLAGAGLLRARPNQGWRGGWVLRAFPRKSWTGSSW